MSKRLVVAAVLLAALVPVVYVTWQAQQRPGPYIEADDDYHKQLQHWLDDLRAQGVVDRLEGDRCIVGPAFADLDTFGQHTALLIAYRGVWTHGTDRSHLPMIVVTGDGRTIGQYTPGSGLSPP